ncbi:MAG: metallopeptidase family protein [Patescibacteria group bacterium]|jgi:predicted Zn-dependent protease with MMP-like domain
MNIPNEQFDLWVAEAIDELPDEILRKTNNVAFFVEDYPSEEQLKKARLNNKHSLFGLYEGYIQSKKINIGPVLPDRITIFRRPILESFTTEREVKNKIKSVVRHEIAHHFGSDEEGARKVGK